MRKNADHLGPASNIGRLEHTAAETRLTTVHWDKPVNRRERRRNEKLSKKLLGTQVRYVNGELTEENEK